MQRERASAHDDPAGTSGKRRGCNLLLPMISYVAKFVSSPSKVSAYVKGRDNLAPLAPPRLGLWRITGPRKAHPSLLAEFARCSSVGMDCVAVPKILGAL